MIRRITECGYTGVVDVYVRDLLQLVPGAAGCATADQLHRSELGLPHEVIMSPVCSVQSVGLYLTLRAFNADAK